MFPALASETNSRTKRRSKRRAPVIMLVCSLALGVHALCSASIHSEYLASTVDAAFGHIRPEEVLLLRAPYSIRVQIGNELGRSPEVVPNHTFAYKRVEEPAPDPCEAGCGTWRLPGDSEPWNNPDLLLDVYLPLGPALRPIPDAGATVLFHIHGGGWERGSRRFLRANYRGGLPRSMLELGVVVVSVDYRLAKHGWRGEHMLSDISDALAYVKQHAVEWGANPGRIVPYGTSAGGHLSSLLAYTTNDPAIIGVVPLYGIFEIRPHELEHRPGLGLGGLWDRHVARALAENNLCGRGDLAEPSAAAELVRCLELFSPAAHVSARSPPTLIVHGRADALVPLHQAEILREALQREGVPHALVDIRGADHDCDTRCSGPCGQAAVFAFERFLRFVERRAALSDSDLLGAGDDGVV
jgi:acetyl esterase/lipase